jgi:peptide subunit release factor 1 (eRF1)
MASNQPAEPLVDSVEEHLERLLAFEPVPLPVITVYLNTQPDPHGRTPDFEPYLRREFRSLASTWPAASAERESFERDAEAIIEYAASSLKPESNGAAIFACSGAGGFFEALQMSAPIDENRIYVYHQPHIYHLARLDDQYPRYAALAADANSARIFVFGLGQVIETEQVKGKRVQRVKVGGWSQARYQRRVDNAHQQHAKEVAEALDRIAKQEDVRHIIIAGGSEMLPLIRDEISRDLQQRIVDLMSFDANASEKELFEATLEKMREQDSDTDAQKVAELFDRYRSRGLAVVGAEATLTALANGQVEELLLSASLEATRPEQEKVDAILAPEIPDSTGGSESEEPREASLPDLLVTKAKQTGARVTFIEDASLLDRVEGVGAFLRWRA